MTRSTAAADAPGSVSCAGAARPPEELGNVPPCPVYSGTPRRLHATTPHGRALHGLVQLRQTLHGACTRRRLCVETAIASAATMTNALLDCRNKSAHVCTHGELQQACSVFNAYAGSATGWYGDHARVEAGGNTDDEYLTWNRNSCDTNNDGHVNFDEFLVGIRVS